MLRHAATWAAPASDHSINFRHRSSTGPTHARELYCQRSAFLCRYTLERRRFASSQDCGDIHVMQLRQRCDEMAKTDALLSTLANRGMRFVLRMLVPVRSAIPILVFIALVILLKPGHEISVVLSDGTYLLSNLHHLVTLIKYFVRQVTKEGKESCIPIVHGLSTSPIFSIPGQT